MKTSSRSELKTWQETETCDPVIYATKQVHATQPLAPAIEPEAGWTPGVWGVPDKREHIVTVINEQGFEITIAKCGESYVLSDAEMKANAALIARAPAMAAALAEIIRIGFTSTDDVQARDKMLALARGALKGNQ